MTQCLRWVTDAYNEFLAHGMLSDEHVNRLQMVYDKLKTSEMADGSGGAQMQTMSELKTMIGTSGPTKTQIPSLLNMSIPPPMSASAIPTVGAAEANPLSATVTSHQDQRSRGRSVEKPLLPTPDAADGRPFVPSKSHPQSPDSRASSGLANSITMEFGSENGGGPYSPFDSPFSLPDAKLPFSAPHDSQKSEFGFGSSAGRTQEDVKKDRGTTSVPPRSSPFGGSANGDRSHVNVPPPPPPVLSPQDILAGRIYDELALVEVLVRIQFELASIGDLPAEDAETAVTSEPSTQPQIPTLMESPQITTTESADPKSVLGDTSSLPALPSPGSLQEMIAQSTSPTSAAVQSPAVTAVSAAVSETAVSLSQFGKAVPSAATVRGRMPSTPPIVSASTPGTPATIGTPVAVKPGATPDPAVPSTSVITKSQPSSSQQSETSTSSRRQQPKTSSSSSTKSDTGNKSSSKDSSEKVFHRLACRFLSKPFYFTKHDNVCCFSCLYEF